MGICIPWVANALNLPPPSKESYHAEGDGWWIHTYIFWHIRYDFSCVWSRNIWNILQKVKTGGYCYPGKVQNCIAVWMSEKFLKHTEGQYMRSTSVSLWKDVYSHKVHKHISSRWDACMCVATHTVQEAKADCRSRIFLLSILNAPPVSQSPWIQSEPWGRLLISIQ